MMNYNEKKFVKRSVFWLALAGAVVGACGCGDVTPLAPDGGGGEGGRVTLSTGGAGSAAGTGGEATGGAAGTVASTGGAGGTPSSTGGGAGDPPSTGGAAGTATGGKTGTGGTAGSTPDAGTDVPPACPRSAKTSGLEANTLTTLNGTSTGFSSSSCSAQGGGPNGTDLNCALGASFSAVSDFNNPPAASQGSVVVPIVQDCNGAYQTDDVNLQGYVASLWVYIQGIACNSTIPIGWRIGVVSAAGTKFPWGSEVGALTGAACTGVGAALHGTAFPAGTLGHAIVLQFMNQQTQAFSGIIDVSDVALTFN